MQAAHSHGDGGQEQGESQETDQQSVIIRPGTDAQTERLVNQGKARRE